MRAKFKQNAAVHAAENVLGPEPHINNAARNKDILTKSLIVVVFSVVAAKAIWPAFVKFGSVVVDDQDWERYRVASMINNTLVHLVLPCVLYFKSKGLRRHVKEFLRSMLGQLNIEL